MKTVVIDAARVLRGAAVVFQAQTLHFHPRLLRAAITKAVVQPCQYSYPNTSRPHDDDTPSTNGGASESPTVTTDPGAGATDKAERHASRSSSTSEHQQVNYDFNSSSSSSSSSSHSHPHSVSAAINPSIPFEKPHVLVEPKPQRADLDQSIPTSSSPSTATAKHENNEHERAQTQENQAQKVMRERRVPQSSISRIAAFGSLGASLLTGAAAEVTRRTFNLSPSTTTTTPSSSSSGTSAFLTESNAKRVANTLSRMRGAALKLGQMLSIQDEEVIPKELSEALERVRQNADIMPRAQLYDTLTQEYGTVDWKQQLGFVSFDDIPIAAASIGQVHKACINMNDDDVDSNNNDMKDVDVDVVLKIQYPGVANSIHSDIQTLRRVLKFTNLVPDSFYLDQALDVGEKELKLECNYGIEKENQQQYRNFIQNDEKLKHFFYVPFIVDHLSTKQILCSEYIEGKPIDHISTSSSRQQRNEIATNMLRLTIRELFIFEFQQSDPNWANYLYDEQKHIINLIDFGAAKKYPSSFLNNYLNLIIACADSHHDAIIQHSIKLGFLTGEESKQMINAHIQASLAVGEPFRYNQPFDFETCDIPKRTAQFGKTMLDQRLTPPPQEAYSLHRRLSGAFLLSTKLNASVNARAILLETMDELKNLGRFQPP